MGPFDNNINGTFGNKVYTSKGGICTSCLEGFKWPPGVGATQQQGSENAGQWMCNYEARVYSSQKVSDMCPLVWRLLLQDLSLEPVPRTTPEDTFLHATSTCLLTLARGGCTNNDHRICTLLLLTLCRVYIICCDSTPIGNVRNVVALSACTKMRQTAPRFFA